MFIVLLRHPVMLKLQPANKNVGKFFFGITMLNMIAFSYGFETIKIENLIACLNNNTYNLHKH